MQEPIPGVPLEQAPFGPLGRQLLAVCKAASVLGSAVFVLLVIMSIVSIVGRKLWSAPVPGDVELLQVCSAFAASTFFAYCHLNGGDVKVDFFTAHLRAARVHLLDAGGSLLVGLFGALLAWRTAAGALGVREAAETTMILDLPLWWGQIAMVPGFVLLALAGFYMVAWHLGQSRVAPVGVQP
ncbi:MAG: TRAP transporter small permease [Rhodoferax sp.]|uniref:TRAP transporter small permease n=1 Tax=Rhodoferax sp. TaxID=50421 RepID=UPI003264084B